MRCAPIPSPGETWPIPAWASQRKHCSSGAARRISAKTEPRPRPAVRRRGALLAVNPPPSARNLCLSHDYERERGRKQCRRKHRSGICWLGNSSGSLAVEAGGLVPPGSPGPGVPRISSFLWQQRPQNDQTILLPSLSPSPTPTASPSPSPSPSLQRCGRPSTVPGLILFAALSFFYYLFIYPIFLCTCLSFLWLLEFNAQRRTASIAVARSRKGA